MKSNALQTNFKMINNRVTMYSLEPEKPRNMPMLAVFAQAVQIASAGVNRKWKNHYLLGAS